MLALLLPWVALAAAEPAPAGAPARVCVAGLLTTPPSARGPVAADELADRLALVPSLAVIDRDRVRAAERALGWSAPTDDPRALAELGRRLQATLVIGGRLDGGKARVVWVAPAAGEVQRAEVSVVKARADAAAAAIAEETLSRHARDVPALARAAITAVDGDDRAVGLYTEAREALYGGNDVKRAIAGLEEAARAAPSLARAQATLSRARLMVKDGAGARAAAEAAMRAGGGLREARLALARALDDAERVDEAVAAYREVLAVAPHDASASTNLGRLLVFKKRDAAGGIAALARALETEPTFVVARVNRGLAALSVGRAEEAVTLLEPLARESPTVPPLALPASTALRRAGRPARAEAVARAVLEAMPAQAEARFELALALAEEGRHDDALRVLDDPAAPAEARLRVARGRVLLGKGDLDGAARVLDEVAAAQGKSVSAKDRRDARLARAIVELRRGRPAEAKALLLRAVDEDPADVEASHDLAVAAEAAGDAATAREAYARAHQAMPWSAAPAIGLARLLLPTEPGRAVAVCDRALAGGPTGDDAARLRMLRGLGRWRGGAAAAAVDDLRAAADGARAPSLAADARAALAEALLAAGKREEARAEAAKALALPSGGGDPARRERLARLAR
jgi:tetratricopeptide (TPR) repeat protein